MKKNRKPLPRSTKPIRRSALPRATRPSKRFAKLRNPDYCEWIRQQPCVCDRSHLVFVPPESEIQWILFHKECSGPIEGAHVKARSVGGADVGNMVPLCRGHHREQHTVGMQSFIAKYFELAPLALKYTEWWSQTDDGLAWQAGHPTGEREQP